MSCQYNQSRILTHFTRGTDDRQAPAALDDKDGACVSFPQEKRPMSAIVQMSDKSLPEDCLLFKHSTSCPVSAAAAEEVKTLRTGLPVYWVNVIEQRALSNWVAETYAVAHESPQLILIRGGARKKVWNHYSIVARDVTVT
jgi:bacillithiol system protein YtxJ